MHPGTCRRQREVLGVLEANTYVAPASTNKLGDYKEGNYGMTVTSRSHRHPICRRLFSEILRSEVPTRDVNAALQSWIYLWVGWSEALQLEYVWPCNLLRQ